MKKLAGKSNQAAHVWMAIMWAVMLTITVRALIYGAPQVPAEGTKAPDFTRSAK